MASGRNAKATALMQEALKSQENPAFRTTLGLSLVGAGQTANGIGELESAYRKDPRQVQAATALIRLYLQTSQARKAVPVAEQLVKAHANNAFFHNLLGMALGQSGNLSGARASFERAIAIDGRLQQAILNLSRLDIAVNNHLFVSCVEANSGLPNNLAYLCQHQRLPIGHQRADVDSLNDWHYKIRRLFSHLRIHILHHRWVIQPTNAADLALKSSLRLAS
jgi:tetratricopeptide (TPR) repeat protein